MVPLEKDSLWVFHADAERQVISSRFRAQLLDVLVSFHHLYHHDLHLSHGQTFSYTTSGPTAEDEGNKVLVLLAFLFLPPFWDELMGLLKGVLIEKKVDPASIDKGAFGEGDSSYCDILCDLPLESEGNRAVNS